MRLRLRQGTHIKLIPLNLKSPAFSWCPHSAVVDSWAITMWRRIQVVFISDFWIVWRGQIVIVLLLCYHSLEPLVTIHHWPAVEADPNCVVERKVHSLWWGIGSVETIPEKSSPAIYRRVNGDISTFTKNLNSQENIIFVVLIPLY